MTHLILIAHLPLIRMRRDEDFPIAGGFLTRLPWKQFDDLTKGAFSDWKDKFERTDPVFFWYQEEAALPFIQEGLVDGMEEIKVPPASFDTLLTALGYDIVRAFHEQLVDPLWAALALAAPCGIAAPPRSSVTFFMPAGEHHFAIGDRVAAGARIQGDADMELVYLADGAGEPLDDALLERTAALLEVARAALADDSVSPALRQLLDSADVILTPTEQMLLAVSSTENLLFPDASAERGKTFARRLANLLAHDTPHRDELAEVAGELYRHRSRVIHADQRNVTSTTLPAQGATQLLAGSIEALSRATAEGADIVSLRRRLDDGGIRTAPQPRLPLADAPGRAGAWRSGPRKPWFAGTWSSSGSLASPPGSIVSWSPLVGLERGGDMVAHEALGVHLGALEADAIVGMEEKDIRRDFISKTRLGGSVAALAVVAAHPGGMVDEAHVLPLTRVRDLAVVGLRLAGLDAFIDPSLLGWYVYDGNLRHRRETVLRQSIIMAMEAAPAVAIAGERLDATFAAWSLLARYEATARNEDIDRVMDLYRRGHDRRFLDPVTRASLLAIGLEALLGRFRSPTAAFRLEKLVHALDGVPHASRIWFETQGREFRNAVAHGAWRAEPIASPEWWTQDHEPLKHFLAVLGAALRQLLELWIDADRPVRARHGPQGLLKRTLRERIS